MNAQAIKRVIVELEDGTIIDNKIPPHTGSGSGQGFYRQRFTYDGVYDKSGNFLKWTNRIYYTEVIWTLTEEQVQSDQYKPTYQGAGRSDEPHPSSNGADQMA